MVSVRPFRLSATGTFMLRFPCGARIATSATAAAITTPLPNQGCRGSISAAPDSGLALAPAAARAARAVARGRHLRDVLRVRVLVEVLLRAPPPREQRLLRGLLRDERVAAAPDEVAAARLEQ